MGAGAMVRYRAVFVLLLVASSAIPTRAQPIRHGIGFDKTQRVILDLGGAGAFDETQAKYPSVMRVGDEWWMWYNGRSADSFTGQIGLATSSDGLEWTNANGGQPVLRHGPPGSFDSTKVDHPAVVRFDGKYHMWYTAGDAASRYKIGYATSIDGVVWQRENNAQPVLGPGEAGRFDDQVVLHPAVLRDDEGTLHMWYNGVGPQQSFRVGYATSLDGIHWERQNNGDPVLTPSEVDGRMEQYVYNVMALLEDGTFHMWYTSMFDEHYQQYAPESNGIVYAQSTDGTHWIKDSAPIFYNGPQGSLDEYAAYAPYVVRREDALWMYYSVGHLVDTGGDPRRMRTSLAISQPRALTFTWNTAGLGDWNGASNWEPSFEAPPTGDDGAIFGDVLDRVAPSSVIVDSDVTIASIQFDSPITYAIVGVGSVNLAAGQRFPNLAVDVQQGDHEFQVVVNLQSDTAANVANNATLTFNNALNLGKNNLTLTGPGEVVINNDLTGDGTVIMQSGVLSGGGSIEGGVDNQGGTISPGSSPGVMVIREDLIQAEDGTLSIELAGTAAGSEYDVLRVDGLASLGGALDVSLLNEFEPIPGDTFDILDFDSLTGRFDEIRLPELASGIGWDVSALYSDGTISVVPEPNTLLLLLGGGIAAYTAARPRRRTLSVG